jgi:hypothetical protein
VQGFYAGACVGLGRVRLYNPCEHRSHEHVSEPGGAIGDYVFSNQQLEAVTETARRGFARIICPESRLPRAPTVSSLGLARLRAPTQRRAAGIRRRRVDRKERSDLSQPRRAVSNWLRHNVSVGGTASRYGLSAHTGPPAARSAAALIRALGGLAAHHERARSAVTDAFADFDQLIALHAAVSGAANPPSIQQIYIETVRGRIEDFGEARCHLIGTLEPLCDPSSDLIIEVNSLFGAGGLMDVDVEAPAPERTLDIPAPPLSAIEHIRVASDTLDWSRKGSYPHALLAGKASHVLSEIITQETEVAAEFAASCKQVEQEVDTFLALIFTPPDR